MSGSASISLEQAILGHTLGFAQMVFRSPVFVALCSASIPPSETVQGIEAFGGGYTRMRATFALIDTPANIAANTTSIEWPVATASWGTLGFFELWDAPAGGNRLYWGPFSPPDPITVAAGDIMRFSAGTLAVQASTGTGGTTSIGAYLPLAGGSMTGPLLLSHDPATYLEAATKQYVDAHSGAGGGPGFLPLSGGTMLGSLVLNGNATLPLHAVPLQQVDTLNVVNVLNHGAKGDGTTDDTAAIQTALSTYAGKAVVFIPDTGHPYMCGALTLPTRTDLLIHGTIKSIAGTTDSVLSVNNANDVIIRGNGVLDGNGAAQTAPPRGLACIGMSNANRVQVSGLTLQNPRNWTLNVVGSNSVRIDNLTMTGGSSAAEFAAGSSDCWLMNCAIDGTNNPDYGFAFYGGVTNSGAIGNTVKNAGAGTAFTPPAIGVLSDSGQPALCRDIVIADNICHDSGGPGVSVLGIAGSIATGVVISNNRSYNNNKIGSGGVAGADIFVEYASNVTIAGNQLSANGSAAGTAFSGIFFGPHASYVSVVGNQIYNTGQGTTTGAAIWNSGANYVYVAGNYIYDTQTTPTMQYAMIGGAGSHNAYVGNFFDRPVNIGVASDTIIANANSTSGNQFRLGPNTVLSATLPMTFTNASAIPRWYVGQDSATESGGNSGSNFEFVNVSDGNTILGTPVTINRASGVVNFASVPTYGSGSALPFLPLSGGTLTGAVNATDLTATTLTASGITVQNANMTAAITSGYTQLSWNNADTVIGTQSANATTATSGHLLIPFCAGAPTGIPANASKGTAIRYDTTNHKLWAYDSGSSTWRGIVLT